MSHIATGRPSTRQSRPYSSPVRSRLAAETRARILDAAVRVMADGVSQVSVPAIAGAAGVSIPTVYRHFATKPDLLAAVYPHILQRAGLNELRMPASLDELRTAVGAVIDHLDAFDDLARAAFASPAAEEARHESMPRRLALTRRFAETLEPKLDPEGRDRVARLLVILTSSSALRTWRDHLGVSADQVAADIEWIIRSVAAGAPRLSSR